MTYALVCGGGADVWRERESALAMLGPPAFAVACNEAAVHFPGALRGFCTLHPEKLPAWLETRAGLRLPAPDAVFSHKARACVTRVVPHKVWPGGLKLNRSGSSGLFCVRVALELGATHVVVCGVPMTATLNRFSQQKWAAAEHYRVAWEAAAAVIGARCRSMSGWTRELLGPPTPEWLTRLPD